MKPRFSNITIYGGQGHVVVSIFASFTVNRASKLQVQPRMTSGACKPRQEMGSVSTLAYSCSQLGFEEGAEHSNTPRHLSIYLVHWKNVQGCSTPLTNVGNKKVALTLRVSGFRRPGRTIHMPWGNDYSSTICHRRQSLSCVFSVIVRVGRLCEKQV